MGYVACVATGRFHTIPAARLDNAACSRAPFAYGRYVDLDDDLDDSLDALVQIYLSKLW